MTRVLWCGVFLAVAACVAVSVFSGASVEPHGILACLGRWYGSPCPAGEVTPQTEEAEP